MSAVVYNPAPGASSVGTSQITDGSVTTADVNSTASLRKRAITFMFAGSSLAADQYLDFYVPYACTIAQSSVMGDVVGDVVFGVKVSAAYNTAPVTSIVASAPPTLTGDDGSQDTTLTGWTTSIAAGSRMRVTVTSTATLAWASLTLTVTLA